MKLNSAEIAVEIFELWVSPDGNDAATGGIETPFRTLRRAHDALREIAQRVSGLARITVYLANGTHRLDDPLKFDTAFFGTYAPEIHFKAAPGATPIISGAIRIDGWSLHDAERNIYKAAVGGYQSRQLFVNGRRATRARTRSAGGANPAGFLPKPVLPTHADETPYVISGGIQYAATTLNPARWRNPAQWRNPQAIEAVITTQWKMMRVPLREVIPTAGMEGGLIHLQQPAWTNANLFFDSNTSAPGIWSFWQVSYFENAYEFLEQAGDWYLDHTDGEIFYIPREGEDMASAEVELPILETLIEARGTPDAPVSNLSFEGITFRYATWLAPGSKEGYVADQSGFHVTGEQHRPNLVGHVRELTRTPGNLSFEYAHHIVFEHSRFEHLGAVALDLGSGCQHNRVVHNHFDDISSAAIQLGGIATTDRSPGESGQYTRDNLIAHNAISRTGRDFVDAAAIYAGFTCNTLIEHNSIDDVPWSGIAIGWGWGLLDVGMFPGLPGATSGMWGDYQTPTPNSGNRILRNRISRFLQNRWDGGAIYTTGQQGLSMNDALLIEGNVAFGKRLEAGGNTFYTDGGTRYVVLRGNASFNNPIGHVDLGPPPQAGDPLPYPDIAKVANLVPYGSDIGGCRTYGHIRYENNYWMAGLIPLKEMLIDLAELALSYIFCHGQAVDTYSPHGFFNICPYEHDGVAYPTQMRYLNNHNIPIGKLQVPQHILDGAGPVVLQTPPPLAGDGASFPPANPGPSWNVPRVSLPGLYGMQQNYAQEWWYYVGTVYDTGGMAFSLQIEIARLGDGPLQIGWGVTGIGWTDATGLSHYLCGLGFGLGAAETPLELAALVCPPVDDYSYSVSFVPLLEVVDRSSNLLKDFYLNLPSPNQHNWKFAYLREASAGALLGEIGSRYSVAALGRGYATTADSNQTSPADYQLALSLSDQRGTVMEGISGYVGPDMFADGSNTAPASYECAQPHLQVMPGGTIEIDGMKHTIASGYLWLDRQMIAAPAATSSTIPNDAEGLKQYLAQQLPKNATLYCGDWMGIVLNDGRCVTLVEFWQKSSPQWITGTAVDKPPKNGFGNLYFPVSATVPPMNGGIGLRPRQSMHDPDWDFDVNLLETVTPEDSPHWTSPISGKTYASAWQLEFSPRIVETYGLAQYLYVFAISDNCEIVPTDNQSAFFEGAAQVYADPQKKQFIGHAFVEQMGF